MSELVRIDTHLITPSEVRDANLYLSEEILNKLFGGEKTPISFVARDQNDNEVRFDRVEQGSQGGKKLKGLKSSFYEKLNLVVGDEVEFYRTEADKVFMLKVLYHRRRIYYSPQAIDRRIYGRGGVVDEFQRRIENGISVYDNNKNYTLQRGSTREEEYVLVDLDGSKRSLGRDFYILDLSENLDQISHIQTLDKRYSFNPSQDSEQTFISSEIQTAVENQSDFLSEVYLSDDEIKNLTELIKIKKNVILQGPPGVGKTFVAKKLAYHIMGVRDKERVEMIQFHQNYSYEDFVMGYRPKDTGGFELKTGVFYNFCKKAEIDPENDYFFIIDEINRGNLSKVFGELFMLIENSYRGEEYSIKLQYRDEESFSVPKNLYIIGLMNTADRSLAMLDYALRRRFSFFDMKPSFDDKLFTIYQEQFKGTKFEEIIKAVKDVNDLIKKDSSLGEGFLIGHSYFCGYDANNRVEEVNNWLKNIVDYDILPMLKEYWFDNPDQYEDAKKLLEEGLSAKAKS